MNLVLELPSELEKELATEAARLGLPLSEYAVRVLAAGRMPGQQQRIGDATEARVADLIRRQKTTSLTQDETAELNQYLQIEHLMRLAKARARQRLAAG